MHAVRKYLERWAEPETKLAARMDGGYARCLVVPACREQASLLDGFTRAAATSSGRTLCVLVVNCREDAPAEHHAVNASFVAELRASLGGARLLDGDRAVLGASKETALDVLVVDRASEGRRFPPKAGVGLARKVGMDLSLALHVAGKVTARLVYCADADVVLPDAHFERPELEAFAGAAVFPFWHEPSDDAGVTRATALYELSLRYYVAGLSFAGSPYAFHTVGSAMAVAATPYAAVRGTPKREAGEDFYLLGKVAKVAPVVRAPGTPIRIRSRASDRTPFGTGADVARGLTTNERAFYVPESFVALGRWLRELDKVAEDASLERLHSRQGGLSRGEWDATLASFEPGWEASLGAALRGTSSAALRRVRVHEWFDAFRTLKFVHALRDRVAPTIPFRDALARAPFTPSCVATETDLDSIRCAFADAEASGPERFGPRARLSRVADSESP